MKNICDCSWDASTCQKMWPALCDPNWSIKLPAFFGGDSDDHQTSFLAKLTVWCFAAKQAFITSSNVCSCIIMKKISLHLWRIDETLLMVQKSQTTTVWMYPKNLANNGISTTSPSTSGCHQQHQGDDSRFPASSLLIKLFTSKTTSGLCGSFETQH